MLGIDRRSVQNFDWTLLALVLLSTAGLVNLYSAPWTPDGLSRMRRQLVSFGIGAVVACCAPIDYRHFERFAAVAFGWRS